MIYIEKRKKGDEKWEEISLEKMVDEIEEFEHKKANKKLHSIPLGSFTRQSLSNARAPTQLYIALKISLTHKYETTDAEYRII